eukprot:7926244-Alexandrium_andersonii.AAC.1
MISSISGLRIAAHIASSRRSSAPGPPEKHPRHARRPFRRRHRIQRATSRRTHRTILSKVGVQ